LLGCLNWFSSNTESAFLFSFVALIKILKKVTNFIFFAHAQKTWKQY